MQICIKPVHILYNHTHTHTRVLIISYLLCVYTYFFALGYITLPYIKFHSTTVHYTTWHSIPLHGYHTWQKWNIDCITENKNYGWPWIMQISIYSKTCATTRKLLSTMWKMMGLEDDPATFWVPVKCSGATPEKLNIAPDNRPSPPTKVVFWPLFFRGHVSFLGVSC